MKASRATLFYASRLLLIETRAMTITVRNVIPGNLYGALFQAGFRINAGWTHEDHKRWAPVYRVRETSFLSKPVLSYSPYKYVASPDSDAEASGQERSVVPPECIL